MAWNAYLAVNHLRQTQKIAALTLESSTIQANISGVLKDLTDMETGQRGYLLNRMTLRTCSPTPTRRAGSERDFAGLRAGLADRAESERSLVSQLESLAELKAG